ncbi:MAG: phosphoenolpyruvate--protein phosphotransferase [Pyrinomonadaceae bacterium]
MSARDKLPEEKWRGLGVSEGTAVGKVLRVHGGRSTIFRVQLDDDDVERELRRFRAAVRLSRRQLRAIKASAEEKLGIEHAYIFDAHLLMLQDRKLVGDIENFIQSEKTNAEWAIKVVSDRILAVYSEIKDDYLRERGTDIEDVVQRLLVAVSGKLPAYRRLTENAIIVARELMPSAVAELDFNFVRAIATDTGGWTSHAAIIARGLGLPSVVGLKNFYSRARTGDAVIVDASSGKVCLHPSPATVKHFEALVESRPARVSAVDAAAHGPVLTTDGVEIKLRANVELPAEFGGVETFGAQGIGLYRTEFLFTQYGGMPNEAQQIDAYRKVAAIAGADGATLRLFDLGGDKANIATSNKERNPALGLRAIRLSLVHQEILRTQVRAILQAAADPLDGSAVAPLRMVLPMVNDVSDVRRARAVIDEERRNLIAAGLPIGDVAIGAMIELPSAVFCAESLAREVDFFSLGTNDLVQYTLAVDRANDDVSDWFRTLHPAVLTSISMVLKAAANAGKVENKPAKPSDDLLSTDYCLPTTSSATVYRLPSTSSGIPAVICGEMAGTPAYAAVLVGLGARELSMASGSVPRVRRTLSGIDAASVAAIGAQCLSCATADEVEALVSRELRTTWTDLFPPASLPANANATGT